MYYLMFGNWIYFIESVMAKNTWYIGIYSIISIFRMYNKKVEIFLKNLVVHILTKERQKGKDN